MASDHNVEDYRDVHRASELYSHHELARYEANDLVHGQSDEEIRGRAS